MLKRFIIIIILLVLGQSHAWCQNQVEEYNLKAAFVYNFTRYINWGTFTPDEEFVIGVVGSSPIYEPLVEIARTKTVNDKKIVIKSFSKADDITTCNILY